MPKYRRKPVEQLDVEAVKFVPNVNFPMWFIDGINQGFIKPLGAYNYSVTTEYGTAVAALGDYIVLKPNGEFEVKQGVLFDREFEPI